MDLRHPTSFVTIVMWVGSSVEDEEGNGHDLERVPELLKLALPADF
jgi:hypothetical protein